MTDRNCKEVLVEGEKPYGFFAHKWTDECADFLASKKYKKIKFEGHFGDMLFLEDYSSFVEDISVVNEDGLVDGISSLTNLKILEMPYKSKTEALCFSNLKSLKSCKVLWDNRYIDNLFSLRSLKTINLESFSNENFKLIPVADSVEALCLTRPSILSLEGVDSFGNLKLLSISHARKLANISDLKRLNKLEHLNIFSAKHLSSIQGVEGLICLKSIMLTNVSGIDDISFMLNMKKMEKLVITGIPVEIDLNDFIKLKKLMKISIYTYDKCIPDDEVIAEMISSSGKKCLSLSRQGTKKNPLISITMSQ